MSENSVWPPPPNYEGPEFAPKPIVSKPKLSMKLLGLCLAIGIVESVIDSRTATFLTIALLFFVSLVFGILQPRFTILWSFLLTFCRFLVHMVAILAGGKPPYVESDIFDAFLSGLFYVLPVLIFFGLLGAGIRKLWDWFQQRTRTTS